MNILITICARGGSKGIPGKNIKPLNGIPLIAYTIQVAQQFADLYNGHIGLSTDSDVIRSVATNFGVETEYRRPEYLATDQAGKVDAIKDLLLFEEEKNTCTYDYILDLDVTSPLRSLEDLINAYQDLISKPEALNIFSVSKAARNPYFNMVEQHKDGFVRLVKKGEFKSRQYAPLVYDMNASFYFFRRKFFTDGHRSGTTEASLAFVVPHLCFDLDEPHDFVVMDILLKENLLDFMQ